MSPDQINLSDTMIKVCAACGLDNLCEYYLKNGIAFVQKDYFPELGYSEMLIQWKDR